MEEYYNYTITLGIEYGFVLRNRGPLNLYAAVGPSFSYSRHSHSDNDYATILGASAAIGIEWMIIDYIGVSVEYSGLISYGWSKDETIYSNSKLIREVKGWNVRGTGARLLLSILL